MCFQSRFNKCRANTKSMKYTKGKKGRKGHKCTKLLENSLVPNKLRMTKIQKHPNKEKQRQICTRPFISQKWSNKEESMAYMYTCTYQIFFHKVTNKHGTMAFDLVDDKTYMYIISHAKTIPMQALTRGSCIPYTVPA